MSDQNGGGSNSGRAVQAKFAGDIAQGAGRLVAALGGVLQRLGENPRDGDGELRATLAHLAMEVDEQRLRALDIASGENERRKLPLAAALAKAQAEGGDAAWSEAMACLAQFALGEARPAWYAGALCSSMGLDASTLSKEAARALVEPLDMERSLGAPGMSWAWEVMDADQAKKAWMAIAERAGMVWRV